MREAEEEEVWDLSDCETTTDRVEKSFAQIGWNPDEVQ